MPVPPTCGHPPRAQARPFCGNPWGITLAEAKILVRLPDQSRREIAEDLGIRLHTIQSQVTEIHSRMHVNRSEAACVYWDRWWQGWQLMNAENGKAAEAREELGL